MKHREISTILGIDPLSPEVQLVRRQNRNDRATLEQLISIRREKFPDTAEFAESIGVSEEAIEDFENFPFEVSIKFVQFYALGVNVEITHELTDIDAELTADLYIQRTRDAERAMEAANWFPNTSRFRGSIKDKIESAMTAAGWANA